MFRALPAAALALVAAVGHAQDYPARAINLIVPNPPGGMNQIHAQPLGAVIEKLYKQPAPVLNKPGATAAAGTAFVANQPPDGYNILVTTPNLYLATEKDKLFGIQSPYKLEQIVPIALLSADPLAFCVQTENPIKTIPELVAAAKAKQGGMSFSSSGPYGITHVPAAMFLDAAGIKMRHVPTTGGGPAVIQLLGGHVDMVVAPAATLSPHVQSGGLRMIAIAAPKRMPGPYADVPSTKELGVNATIDNWRVMIGARGITPPQTAYWENVLARVVATDEWKAMLEKDSLTGEFLRSSETRAQLQTEYAELKAIMTELGLVRR